LKNISQNTSIATDYLPKTLNTFLQQKLAHKKE